MMKRVGSSTRDWERKGEEVGLGLGLARPNPNPNTKPKPNPKPNPKPKPNLQQRVPAVARHRVQHEVGSALLREALHARGGEGAEAAQHA